MVIGAGITVGESQIGYTYKTGVKNLISYTTVIIVSACVLVHAREPFIDTTTLLQAQMQVH